MAIVPPLAFSVLLLQRNNLAQQEIVTTLAEATAGSIMQSVDRQLLGMQTTLRVLSTATSLDAGDFREFHRRADTALSGTGAYLLVMDEDADILMSTRLPYGEPLGTSSDPQPVLEAIASGEPVVSDGFLGRVSQRWVFNVILPWTSSAGEARALVMTQNADGLSEALTGQNLRGGWNAVIVDREGMVLASTFLSSDVGKPFGLDAGEEIEQRGMRGSVSLGGRQYETIAKRSDHNGWQTILWAPTTLVQQPMTRALHTLILGGLAMIAIGAVAALVVGRQISKPIRGLARDARRLGMGEDVTAAISPVAEVSTVSQALAQASADRRAAENEIRFLMREVAHRSKNQLTVVASIAKQTARNARSLDAFQDSFQKRLHGLARSTDLLIAGGVAGVELSELVCAQIEPFRPADESRFSMEGPRFRLSHQAAQTLGLALHELATNASKYGAFASPTGRLDIAWERSGNRLDISWREKVPRLRKRVETRGFGTEVIERMLGGALDAEIVREIHANGLECRFSMPVDKLAPQPAAATGDGAQA